MTLTTELTNLRQENSKTFDLGGGKRRLESHIGAIDLAYAAGIIDGEGCICLHKMGRGYRLSIFVDMCDFTIPQWFYDTFGGRLNTYERKQKYQCGWVRRWDITDSKAKEFLKIISPYLKSKRGQATIAIQFQELKSQHSLLFAYCRGKPLALLEAEAILVKKAQDLNHAYRNLKS